MRKMVDIGDSMAEISHTTSTPPFLYLSVSSLRVNATTCAKSLHFVSGQIPSPMLL